MSPTMEYSLVRDSTNELLVVASERIAALSEIFETSLKPVAQFLGKRLCRSMSIGQSLLSI